MTAPRLDLLERLRKLHEECAAIDAITPQNERIVEDFTRAAFKTLPALLARAAVYEAAEECRSAENDWCQAGDRESVDYMAAFNRVGDARKALDAALAAVRKEEKGE